jgi:hypothetical protein
MLYGTVGGVCGSGSRNRADSPPYGRRKIKPAKHNFLDRLIFNASNVDSIGGGWERVCDPIVPPIGVRWDAHAYSLDITRINLTHIVIAEKSGHQTKASNHRPCFNQQSISFCTSPQFNHGFYQQGYAKIISIFAVHLCPLAARFGVVLVEL